MFGRLLITILLNALWVLCLGILILPTMPEFARDRNVNSILGAVLCSPGEDFQPRNEPNEHPLIEALGFPMTPYCVNSRLETGTDVTEKWLTIGVGGAAVSFVLSMVSELALVIYSIRNKTSKIITQSNPLGVNFLNNRMTLNERLQQIENARQAGTITYDEYDQMRSKILREMTEK
ncbi:MAG: hypothetical protein LCI00_27980 [Chloroflexi bacterium]|nr:hypothetical protein [Chloroflexota bacterium]MCC6893914.1 hypothetical protein [Anaerolineae bacterium]